MAHTFLVEFSYWTLQGHRLKPNSVPVALEGNIQIA